MSENKKYLVDYDALKKVIIKSIRRQKEHPTKFKLDVPALIKNMNMSEVDLSILSIVEAGLESKPITVRDIPFISVYFKESKLEWVDTTNDKEYATFIFINNKAVDDECRDLMKQLRILPPDDIDIDKGKVLAKILANYPCYLAQVLSYTSNNPEFKSSTSYIVSIKANTVTIKNDNYMYNNKDID